MKIPRIETRAQPIALLQENQERRKIRERAELEAERFGRLLERADRLHDAYLQSMYLEGSE